MRCPRCTHQQGARRDGLRCRNCGYRYTYSPRDVYHLTDRKVLAAARRVGRDGRHAFTARQVIADVVSRRRFLWWSPTFDAVSLERTADAVSSLALAHPHRFERMITAPGLTGAATASWPESDIFDYGAERVLVVDQPVLVDLLVSGNVHASARAIIIDVSGYPSRVTELASELVRDRPDVPVAMLHASGTTASSLSAQVALLLQTFRPVRDIGLPPQPWRSLPGTRWTRGHPSVPVDVLPRKALTAALVEALTSDRTLAEVMSAGADDWAVVPSDGDYG